MTINMSDIETQEIDRKNVLIYYGSAQYLIEQGAGGYTVAIETLDSYGDPLPEQSQTFSELSECFAYIENQEE